MIVITNSTTTKDLEQILVLQQKNHPEKLSTDEIQKEGFVTVQHDFETLEAMNAEYPHVIAKKEGEVIGYALVMLQNFRNRIPVLFSLFEKIDRINYQDKLIKSYRYFVMGQVCIAKGFRGLGIFQKMYVQLRDQMSSDFDFVITEVACNNPRSIRAHEKVGFKTVYQYVSSKGEEWAIVLWDWRGEL